MNQQAAVPLLYFGIISFEQQIFRIYYDYSKTGKLIQEQLQNEAKVLGNQQLDALNSQLDVKTNESLFQFKTLYRLQEFKHICSISNLYYLFPFAVPISIVYPRIATILFGTCLTLQTTLFFYDMVKLRMNSNLRPSRKAKELLDSSVLIMMISLGLISCSIFLKRGFQNFYKAIRESHVHSKELALKNTKVETEIKQ